MRISDGIKARGFSHNLAVALVKAWQADARMTRVSEDLIAELCEKLPGASFFVYKMSARAFLGTHSKQANEYLWANKFNSAKLWLMKHGAEKNGSKYLAEVRRLGKQANAHRLAAISEKTGMLLMACDKCCYDRDIADKLVFPAGIGCFPNVYAALEPAAVDQVITL